MSQYDDLIKGTVLKDSYGTLHEVGSEGPSLSMANYEVMMDALNNPDKGGHGVTFWTAVVVGVGLVIFPEPATTATGLAFLAGTFAYSRMEQ